MALTDTAVRLAKPGAKDYSLHDGNGLSLFVSAKGRQVLAFSLLVAWRPAAAHLLRHLS